MNADALIGFDGLGQGDLTRYFRVHEPIMAFSLKGFDRQFLVYSQEALDTVALRLRQGEAISAVYASLCRDTLEGVGKIVALPKGSPPWYRTKRGRWRPRPSPIDKELTS